MANEPLHTISYNSYLYLTPAADSDYKKLYKWRNNKIYIDYLSSREKSVSYEDFVRELDYDFFYERHLQYLIKTRKQDVGTIFSYLHDPTDKFVFVSIFLDENHYKKGLGVKCLILFCKYLFEYHGLYKIYLDVYEFNSLVVKMLKRYLNIEGKFKNQRLIKNKRFDVYRFAMYIEDIKRIENIFINLEFIDIEKH